MGIAILMLQLSMLLLGGVALLYFILKRVEDRKKEKFEKRDN